MPDTSNTNMSPSRRQVGAPVQWAIVVVIRLLAIAAALVLAAINPVMVERIVIVVVSLLIVGVGAAVKMTSASSAELHPITTNDDKIHW